MANKKDVTMYDIYGMLKDSVLNASYHQRDYKQEDFNNKINYIIDNYNFSDIDLKNAINQFKVFYKICVGFDKLNQLDLEIKKGAI